MSDGQHVGPMATEVKGDFDLDLIRAKQAAVKAALKPQARRRVEQTGDGDTCPLDPEHGRMFVLKTGVVCQYCPNQSHDGVWTPEGKSPKTRKVWPYHHLAEAVADHLRGTMEPTAGEAALPDLSDLEV